MQRSDFEDSTARALDLLPAGDAARSDPRLARDPHCAEIIRLTQEAATDVWLATSPLRAAPPDVLSAVMSKVEARTPLARRNTRFFPWLAASGWIAAAVAMILWPHDSDLASRVVMVERLKPGTPPPKDSVAVAPSAETQPPSYRERRLRNELLQLQSRLARLDGESLMAAPRVLSLSSPSGLHRTPEESRQRVWSVLTGALRSALEAESGAPNDLASLVIERGWLPGSMVLADETGVIRHRNFPEDSWQSLGLLRSDDGAYYDPAKDLVWTKDVEGRGFIGRKATDDDNLAAFLGADESLAQQETPLRAEPEGFVIEDPETDLAEVVIDQVPPPEEGHEQLIVWTDSTGRQNTIKVAAATANVPTVPTTEGHSTGTRVAALPSQHAGNGRGASTLVFSIPNVGGLRSFQLIESAIVPNGQAPKVIVCGEHSSRRARLR